jgi:arylsulfatase
MKQPNVILVMCDQMRGDCIGAAGNDIIQTPNLDHLASQGVLFKHAYTAVPSCVPARPMLWTGQNQWHTGVLGMGAGQAPMPNDFLHTLAGELTSAGYQTKMIGKGHFTPQRSLMGFQSTELDESGRMPDSEYRKWFKAHAPSEITPDDHGVHWNSWHARPWHCEEYLHPTHWTMSRALEFLRLRDKSKPFFLNISFARPHSPYVPPAFYFDLYYRWKTPPPYVGDWAEIHNDPKEAKKFDAWRGRMTPFQIHRARSGYYGEVSFIDTQIGRLINTRDADPGNTWIIFTADHGDMQGDHNLWRKTYAYEGSTKIPFIITPPNGSGLSENTIIEEVVGLQDIMPTVLNITGLSVPKTVDGMNLLPLLEGKKTKWRKYIHGEHCTCYSEEQEMQYITDGKRKYIWFPRMNTEQFFDLEDDPGECKNLIDNPDRKDEIEEWRGYLVKELEERDCGWVKDGKPFCPDDKPLISPYRDVRYRK